MWGDNGTSGASKARYKLAAYLAHHGVRVHSSLGPPSDEDFWKAIQQYARTAKIPARPEGKRQERTELPQVTLHLETGNPIALKPTSSLAAKIRRLFDGQK